MYKDFAARGQIEISTTPFYHPILPLLCDSNIAGVSHPYVPLPSRFSLSGGRPRTTAPRQAIHGTGARTNSLGLWPSEGSVSDEVLAIACDEGFKWIGTDNGVLARTLHRSATPDVSYRPYIWTQHGREMHVIFRDHHLSDLIGFVYSKMGAAEAADHFLHHIRMNSAHAAMCWFPSSSTARTLGNTTTATAGPFCGRSTRALQPIRKCTRSRCRNPSARVPAHQIDHIFPGSWINANFDVWIGAEEDNRAWEFLLRAHQAYDQLAANVSEEKRKLAYEELLIAEGSDWCWWYGPEHSSDNRPDFDQLYRDHLTNVYRALGAGFLKSSRARF